MWAAMATNAVTVSTPVPPTPDTTMFHGWDSLGVSVGGSGGNSTCVLSARGDFLSFASITETKLGQNPFTQL